LEGKMKVAVVIGASRGIGEAIAYKLAELKYSVSLAARSEDSLKKVASNVRDKYGVEAIVVRTDVTDESSIKNLFEETLNHYGRIDVLVNSHGITRVETFAETSVEDFEKVMRVNYASFVSAVRCALPQIEENNGMIFNISSAAGLQGYAHQTAYCASKFAVNGYTEALDKEHKPKVRSFALCPGFVNTKLGKEHAEKLIELGEVTKEDWLKAVNPEVIPDSFAD